jgi:hypothetical protein
MVYYIREMKDKLATPRWKVQFITYKKEDTRQSNAQKPRKEWDIPKARWSSLGFKDSMTPDQARSRAKKINAHSLSTNRIVCGFESGTLVVPRLFSRPFSSLLR